MSTSPKAFGPTALATPANALSAARLLAAPVFAVLIVKLGPVSWLLWVLWTVLASSDGLDGLLARRHGTTSTGAFLDPLADKFLVLGALFALAGMGRLSWLPVALISAREIAMSLFRLHAGRSGVSIPARPLAKVKTFVQVLAIGAVFLPPIGRPYPAVAEDLLWAATALTLLTGVEYLLTGRRLIADRARDASRVVDHSVV